MNRRSLNQKHTRFTPRSAGSAASKFGQIIGAAFEAVVIDMIQSYLREKHPAFEIVQLQPSNELNMFGGKKRQIDNVINPIDSDDPVALLETKWLKDGRHHNDKGAWILQLREIRKRYPTIRGTAAVLIGFWTRDVVVFLMNEGQVEAIVVASDEQIYASLQPDLDNYLNYHELEPLTLDAPQIRDRYPRAWDLANFIQWLDQEGKLLPLAQTWLALNTPNEDPLPQTGAQKIKAALDRFLQPLPPNPQILGWEVTLRVSTGNLIHQQFADYEELREFIERYSDPQEIRRRISPKRRDTDNSKL